MIQIQAQQFMKQAAGSITLDRAAMVVIGIDLREGRGGSPGIRCDVAYGTEDAQGKFQAFDYDGPTTVPFYVEPHEFAAYRAATVQAMTPMPGATLLEALALWFEAELVARGKFGEGATVA